MNNIKKNLNKYDSKYLQTYKYVMLLSKNNIINAYFANVDYIYFIEYPQFGKEYNTPLEVLESEMLLAKSDAGIIYENIKGRFHVLAFIDLNIK